MNDNKKYYDKIWIFFPIFGLAIAEFLIFNGKLMFGLIMHASNLLIILVIIIFGGFSQERDDVLQSLGILPLLRIMNISMSQFSTNIHLENLLIYGVLIIQIISIIKKFKVKSLTRYNILSILIFIILINVNIIPNYYTKQNYIGGEIVSAFLIVSLSIYILIRNTKYWNKHNTNILEMNIIPLLFTFVLIVIFKVMQVMNK